MITMTIQCRKCGKEITKPAKYVKRYKYGFCNKACQLQFISETSSATKEKCAHCGCEVMRNNNQKRNSKTGLYFCGVQCKNEYVARHLRWAGNPFQHRSRTETIFKKANFTCQKCGYNEDKRMLDIHHNNGNHHDNDWSNLRCVCVWCHNLHHRKVKCFEDELPVLIT